MRSVAVLGEADLDVGGEAGFELGGSDGDDVWDGVLGAAAGSDWAAHWTAVELAGHCGGVATETRVSSPAARQA